MSNPDVTITLGRSGQVVTKGSKRSIGERFADATSLFSASKRHRGDGVKWNPGVDGANGSQFARNDLRLKLMHKRLLKQSRNVVDEQEKMEAFKMQSKAIQPPASSSMPPFRHGPYRNNLSREISPKDTASDFHRVDSLGRFYSSQSTGVSRAGETRSPVTILRSSYGLSPPRSFNEVRQLTPMWAVDVPRSRPLLSNEILDASRLEGSSRISVKAPSQAGNLLTGFAPPSGIMQKAPHAGEEPLTVASFLYSLGLGKYAIHFQAEEVDMTVLRQMGDNDLKEMGIPMLVRKAIVSMTKYREFFGPLRDTSTASALSPFYMGPRKKILLALRPRAKPQNINTAIQLK